MDLIVKARLKITPSGITCNLSFSLGNFYTFIRCRLVCIWKIILQLKILVELGLHVFFCMVDLDLLHSDFAHLIDYQCLIVNWIIIIGPIPGSLWSLCLHDQVPMYYIFGGQVYVPLLCCTSLIIYENQP